jgi:transposase
VREPQLVKDEGHQQVHERVAGIDVAKASAAVCVRTPDHPNCSQVWAEVAATMASVTELGRRLLAARVEVVTMEATSDYWKIWYYVLESLGLVVQLVDPGQVRQLRGRPKTDKLDAQWLARLTGWGMLRPCFVPAPPIRELREYTRARADLVRDRTRCWQRLEKLLEGALVKVSSVASKVNTESVKNMVRAMIAGERDPQVLAGLAQTSMRAKHDALAEALTGMWQDYHGVLARQLLDQAGYLDALITELEGKIAVTVAALPGAWGADADGVTGPGAGHGPDAARLDAVTRLAEIPGISAHLAMSIIGETGLDMTRFPTAGHLVSWAGLCQAANQSGPRPRKGKKKHGNSYLRGYLGPAAVTAGRTATFLGDRFRRIRKRRGGAIAQVAVARSLLTIIWHLLADPDARYHDLGEDHHASRIRTEKKIRGHISQLRALGIDIPLNPPRIQDTTQAS